MYIAYQIDVRASSKQCSRSAFATRRNSAVTAQMPQRYVHLFGGESIQNGIVRGEGLDSTVQQSAAPRWATTSWIVRRCGTTVRKLTCSASNESFLASHTGTGLLHSVPCRHLFHTGPDMRFHVRRVANMMQQDERLAGLR